MYGEGATLALPMPSLTAHGPGRLGNKSTTIFFRLGVALHAWRGVSRRGVGTLQLLASLDDSADETVVDCLLGGQPMISFNTISRGLPVSCAISSAMGCRARTISCA
jgi:hypothetical protein